MAVVAAAPAWLSSQLEPAWSTRYLAVARPAAARFASITGAARWTVAALAVVAGVWVISGPRRRRATYAGSITQLGAPMRPGDVVVSTQPETVPC